MLFNFVLADFTNLRLPFFQFNNGQVVTLVGNTQHLSTLRSIFIKAFQLKLFARNLPYRINNAKIIPSIRLNNNLQSYTEWDPCIVAKKFTTASLKFNLTDIINDLPGNWTVYSLHLTMQQL